MSYSNVLQGKKVAVNGNGPSGIQIVPAMLPKVAHLDHYIKGRTWISPTFARYEIGKRDTDIENCIYFLPFAIEPS
jgi:cation diffusion facilitator CzcD-associated flavoprotein CzcO